MSSIFDVKIRGPPNEDLVQGFPGISATWPRIEGTVEIRSRDYSLLPIALVTLALYRTDIIHAPLNTPGITAPKKDQSFLVGDEIRLFQVSAGRNHDDVLALDLPFILSLPTNRPIPPSISIGKSVVETSYQLFVSIIYGKQQEYHAGFPIRIKRYDTLSMFGAYKIPIVNSVSSSDHVVGFDYSIPISSYGPGDSMVAFLKIFPNLDWISKAKKVKLQRLSMQVIEIIIFNHEGDEPVEKRKKLSSVAKQVDVRLPEEGYQCEMTMDFPTLDSRDKYGLVPKVRQDIPSITSSGFTTASALYSVSYLLRFKAKFTHCKDIEVEQPITVTPFNHATSMSFIRSINEAVNYSNSVDRTKVPPPKIYKSSDSPLWLGGKSKLTNTSSKTSKPLILVS